MTPPSYLNHYISEPYPLNDLDTEESLIPSDASVEAASVVATENVFAVSDVNEEDTSASNKVEEAAGMCIDVLIIKNIIIS